MNQQKKILQFISVGLVLVFIIGILLQQRQSPQIETEEPANNHIDRPILDDYQYTMFDPSLPTIDYRYNDPLSIYKNQVFLIKSLDELHLHPRSLSIWSEALKVPIYQKEVLTFHQMREKVQSFFLHIELPWIDCVEEVQSLDPWNPIVLSDRVSCFNEEVYVEVYKDGAMHVQMMDPQYYLQVAEDTVNESAIKDALKDSWLTTYLNAQTYDVVVQQIEYDFFDEKTSMYGLMPSMDVGSVERLMVPYIELSFSVVDQAIVGFTVFGEPQEKIDDYPLLQMEEVIEKLNKGLFTSELIAIEDLQYIDILAMELTLDVAIHQTMVFPIVTFYYTSELQKFQACATGDGVKVGKLIVNAIDELYLVEDEGG